MGRYFHSRIFALLSMVWSWGGSGQLSADSIDSILYADKNTPLRTVTESAESDTAAPAGTARQIDNSDSSTRQLDTITVSASKRRRLMETSQSFSVIGSDDWIGSAKSVADIIAGQTGVQTRRYGGTGSYQTVSVRGVRGSEVLVLLDGVPLNSAMGGSVDLGKINPASLGEIEVYRGVTPGRFGGNSIGGVINLKSRSSVYSNAIDGHAALGNYGNQSYSLNAAVSSDDRLRLFVTSAHLRSNNNFPYVDRNNTLYNNLDDTVRQLENARYASTDFRLQPSFKLPRQRRLIGSFFATAIDQQLPAPEGKCNRTARYAENRQTAWLLLADESDEARAAFVPRLGYTRNKSLTTATLLDEGFGASHGGSTYSKYGFVNQQLSADLRGRLLPSDHMSIEPAVTIFIEDGNPTSESDGFGHGDWHSREAQLGAACDARYDNGFMTVTAGGSLRELYSSTEGGIHPYSNRMVSPADTTTAIWAAAGGFTVKPRPELLLFVNAGRYSNPPALRERFGAKGALMSNPELQPETGINGELGIKWNHRKFYLECAGFHTRSRNTIIIIRDGYQSKPKNCEGANISGVEFSALIEPSKYFSIDLRCTAQQPENLTRNPPWDDKLLPDEPVFNCSFEGTLSPLRRLSLSYRLEFKSIYFHDPANTDAFRVPAVTGTAVSTTGTFLHHIATTWDISRNWSLSIIGNNLNASIFPLYPISTVESGYSWVLYPSNEVRCTLKYSFRL